jgi:dihydropyrimidine dehydrogenase (NAD+) subunit PreA
MGEKGFSSLNDFVGLTVPKVGDWGELDLGYRLVAHIHEERCVHCGLCYVACEDGAHQSIKKRSVAMEDYAASSGRELDRSGTVQYMAGAGDGRVNVYEIDEETCVGCNLCALVCPVEGCISMEERPSGLPSMTWSEYQAKLSAGEIEPIKPPGGH